MSDWNFLDPDYDPKYVTFMPGEEKPRGYKTRPCNRKNCRGCERGYHTQIIGGQKVNVDEHRAYPAFHSKAGNMFWVVLERTENRDLKRDNYEAWWKRMREIGMGLDTWKIKPCTVTQHEKWSHERADDCDAYHYHLNDKNTEAILRNERRRIDEEKAREELAEEWRILREQRKIEDEKRRIEDKEREAVEAILEIERKKKQEILAAEQQIKAFPVIAGFAKAAAPVPKSPQEQKPWVYKEGILNQKEGVVRPHFASDEKVVQQKKKAPIKKKTPDRKPQWMVLDI